MNPTRRVRRQGCRQCCPDHIFYSLETFFFGFLGVKILKVFDADPGSGMETVRIRDPGWKKVGSGIRDKHPGSATLVAAIQLHLGLPRSMRQNIGILLLFFMLNKLGFLNFSTAEVSKLSGCYFAFILPSAISLFSAMFFRSLMQTVGRSYRVQSFPTY